MTKHERVTMTTATKVQPEMALLAGMVGRYPLKWVVCYTNPQCERRAFQSLMAAGIMAWLPEMTIERQQARSKKKFTVRKPMFTRYVFAGLDALRRQSYGDTRACDGVEGLVTAEKDGKPVDLGSDVMACLIRRLNGTDEVTAGQLFQVGQRLRIEVGAFAGLTMDVTRHDDGAEVVGGEVNLFGRATPVTLPVDSVKILS